MFVILRTSRRWRVRINPNKFTFLYTNIGRGHPFYLDGIIEEIIRCGKHTESGGIGRVREVRDVFEASRGISLLTWKTTRWLYYHGASNGMVGRLYSAIRRNSNYNNASLSLRLLGRDLRSCYLESDEPLIVAHPSLVGILKNKSNLIYQHGELIIPSEAIVLGASTVIVPTNDVASVFAQHGYADNQIFISGLCVEPSIVRQAETAYESRIARYKSTDPLTGAFSSSGAEPEAHVDLIVRAVMSVIKSDGKTIVFARKGGRLSVSLESSMKAFDLRYLRIDAAVQIPNPMTGLLLVEHSNRREENALTAKLFPEFDYIVSPSHERSNWAIGLGLPMFVVEPCYGPFAPLNRGLLLDRGVGEVIPDKHSAHYIAERINTLRTNGALKQMAQRGWGTEKIDGFARIAEFLLNKYPVLT